MLQYIEHDNSIKLLPQQFVVGAGKSQVELAPPCLPSSVLLALALDVKVGHFTAAPGKREREIAYACPVIEHTPPRQTHHIERKNNMLVSNMILSQIIDI